MSSPEGVGSKVAGFKDDTVFFYFKQDLLIYLKGRVTRRKGEKESQREKSSIHWFTHQMASAAGAVLI